MDSETAEVAAALQEDGVVVIPLLTHAETRKAREDILNAVRNAPELTHPAENPASQACGSFGALGTPSSQNNTPVRELRKLLHLRAVRRVWKAMGPRNLEQLVDRLCARTKKQPKESWHRDETPFAPESDEIFGGWFNAGEASNYFSCAKATHKEKRGKGGFAPIVNPAPFNEKRTTIEVPPGSLVIFYEHLAHEVSSAPVKQLDLRLFVGWRLTDKTLPLIPDIEKRFAEQGTITIKSGQECPMHALLHWTNHRKQLAEYSKQFRLECKTLRTVGSGKHKGEKYLVVKRYLPSLSEMGLPMYPAYTQDEINMHRPGRAWNINGERVEMS